MTQLVPRYDSMAFGRDSEAVLAVAEPSLLPSLVRIGRSQGITFAHVKPAKNEICAANEFRGDA